jgi:hypothetical protein
MFSGTRQFHSLAPDRAGQRQDEIVDGQDHIHRRQLIYQKRQVGRTLDAIVKNDRRAGAGDEFAKLLRHIAGMDGDHAEAVVVEEGSERF